MSELVINRLNEERKSWRKNPPFAFYARPMRNADNSTNMMKWECGIPGPEGSDWEGGLYKLTVEFTDEYPAKAPKCKFDTPLFHPNIYASGVILVAIELYYLEVCLFLFAVFIEGKICLSILKDTPGGWSPGISLKVLLLGIFVFISCLDSYSIFFLCCVVLLAIQDLLVNPNNTDPAHFEASKLFAKSRSEYSKRVREEARKHAPDH